ncbi:hypothetical protein BKA70DRAFT_1265087 [Coprinopsis sp. MPI-PUGE-AT-0042]|nr:hypothetical protein BKA70DRAFT_1265087 [Coprinopsis sp. MPI-PUGE-AT-0042]
MPTNIKSLPICQIFPNTSSLILHLRGRTQHIFKLYENIAFERLTSLELSIDIEEDVILQDVLSHLPVLQQLKTLGVLPKPTRGPAFTHTVLKSLITQNADFHICCALIEFTGMLSPCKLRTLRLGYTPLTETGLYNVLSCLPTLETLLLRVPFGPWKNATGTAFMKLAERSKTRATLPRLGEIVIYMDQVPWKGDVGRYTGFCAFRDAFITFVDDPERWPPEVDALHKTLSAREDQSNLVINQLEAAHFSSSSGIMYHRGRAVEEPSDF